MVEMGARQARRVSAQFTETNLSTHVWRRSFGRRAKSVCEQRLKVGCSGSPARTFKVCIENEQDGIAANSGRGSSAHGNEECLIIPNKSAVWLRVGGPLNGFANHVSIKRLTKI